LKPPPRSAIISSSTVEHREENTVLAKRRRVCKDAVSIAGAVHVEQYQYANLHPDSVRRDGCDDDSQHRCGPNQNCHQSSGILILFVAPFSP
jgi:hypothetical protein